MLTKAGTVKKKLKNAGGVLLLPVLSGVMMAIACRVAGTALFTGIGTWQLFFRGLAYVLLLSFGVSINMHTGRFDFSAGATMLIGGVSGALIAYGNGWGPVAMLAVSMLVGCATGLVTGWLYVLLRLPPMIIGLTMTLVLEGAVAIITDGCKPVGFGTDATYYRFAVTPGWMLLIMLAALALMVVLFHYTEFGYDYRALQTGQRIAVGSGVGEDGNAIGCYAVAGLLFGAAGALSVCSTNGVTPTISFSSIASMFSCFLPLFFSGFIIKFCNKQLAILMGCVAYELIQIGFGQLSFVDAGFTADVYKVVEALILVLFLIYLNNERAIAELVTLRRWMRRRGAVRKEQEGA